MAAICEVFSDGMFVLIPAGIKFPPSEKEWQKHPHSYQEAQAHAGNVGLVAGKGFIGLDQDDPSAFEGIGLPVTTTWETRPGRLGMRFRCGDVDEALSRCGLKPDYAQIKLFDSK